MHQTILIVITAIIFIEFAGGRVLEYLNQLNWSAQLPDELKSICNEQKYNESMQYDRVNYKFSLLTGSVSFMIMIVMLLTGGFGYVDALSRTFTGNSVYVALLFFGILYLFNDIITLPFSCYHTFVIEEKFGFNKTTVKTFILDKFKGYALGIIIGGGLLALFVIFYEWTGKYFWVYIWMIITLLMLLMNLFYTSLILPLFNKLTPLPDGELRSSIEQYAQKVNFPLTNIYVMDGSKRSSKANAFFSGIGSRKKIVLFDTLIKDHPVEELVAILAHEVGHYKKKHTQQSLLLSVLNSGLMLYLLSLIIGNPAMAFALGAGETSFHIGILAFGMLYSPVSILTGLLMNILSRKNEFEADQYAADTYKGDCLKEALKKLSVNHLSNLKPHPAYVFFYYSHPPLLKRLGTISLKSKLAN